MPVNPLLKPEQVAYILRDCNVRILVTSAERLKLLVEALPQCHDLHAVIVTDRAEGAMSVPGLTVVSWNDAITASLIAPVESTEAEPPPAR